MSIEKTPVCELSGVREYSEEMPVAIHKKVENGRLVIVAYNEAGYNFVQIDLEDLKTWLAEHPEGL